MTPATMIKTTFLMTLHASLEPPQRVSRELLIYNVKPGGWVRGPSIQGEIVGPSGDWLHIMPNGTQRLDVRLSILANDGSYIFVQYGGRIVPAEQFKKKNPPPEFAAIGGTYFFTHPAFETESSKYSWLNDLVCIGRNTVEDELVVNYEIFAVA
jgi:uncharacterized protein DUF3237